MRTHAGFAGKTTSNGSLASAEATAKLAAMNTMRTLIFGLTLSCLTGVSPGLRAADPTAGDTRATVIGKLGEPKGILAIGPNEELTYARGSVTLVDGVVTSSKLMPVAEWESRERTRLANERRTVEERVKEAAAKADRVKIADEALAVLLVDPRWKELGGEGRLDTLDRFQKAFPDADLKEVRAEATRRRDLEQEEKRRLSEIEARLEAAELRAEAAENQARNAQSQADAAKLAAKKANDTAERLRRNDDFYGVRTYNELGGGRINGIYRGYGAHPYNSGSSVTISNGNIVITPGTVPPGAHPRPIVIHPPPAPPKPKPRN